MEKTLHERLAQTRFAWQGAYTLWAITDAPEDFSFKFDNILVEKLGTDDYRLFQHYNLFTHYRPLEEDEKLEYAVRKQMVQALQGKSTSLNEYVEIVRQDIIDHDRDYVLQQAVIEASKAMKEKEEGLTAVEKKQLDTFYAAVDRVQAREKSLQGTTVDKMTMLGLDVVVRQLIKGRYD